MPRKGEQGVSVAGVDGGQEEEEEMGSDIMSRRCGPDV